MLFVRFFGCFMVCALAAAFSAASAQDLKLQGAGATFPQPVYAKWTQEYQRARGVTLEYAGVGSGEGVRRVANGLVDFGATDVPLDQGTLERKDLVQFPAIVGGVVPVVHIPGVANNRLQLDGATLADIFMGRITRWDHPALVALNPGLVLPGGNITVVHRSDDSGTTYLWSNFLSQTSARWKSDMGAGSTLAWPVGMGEAGNSGVAASVQRTQMAIGYVEFSYAKVHHLASVRLRNRSGEFVAATASGFAAALDQMPGQESLLTHWNLVDAPGVRSWPISGASYVLLPRHATDAQRTTAVIDFFDWALGNGQVLAEQMDFVALKTEQAFSVLAELRRVFPTVTSQKP